MNEKPVWNRGDVLKSLYGSVALGHSALARLITNVSEFPSRLDTKFADRINENEEDN